MQTNKYNYYKSTIYISSSGARSHFRVAILRVFLPGEPEPEPGPAGPDAVGGRGNMLSVNFNWFIRRRADSISLSRPRRLELRDVSRTLVFLDRGFREGDWQFSSRSRAIIRLRSWSFSNESSSVLSSGGVSGSSRTRAVS